MYIRYTTKSKKMDLRDVSEVDLARFVDLSNNGGQRRERSEKWQGCSDAVPEAGGKE